MLASLGDGIALLRPLLEQNDAATVLSMINEALDQQIELKPASRRAVASTSVDHGDVDLF